MAVINHMYRFVQFLGLMVVSFGITSINVLVMLYFFSLSIIQLHGWKKTFANNWNSDIQEQYNQMHSSLSPYAEIFLLSSYTVLISIIGIRNLIKTWRKILWIRILVPSGILTFFFFLFVVFVSPSKPAEVYAQTILKVCLFYLNYTIFLSLHRMNLHCRTLQVHCFI